MCKSLIKLLVTEIESPHLRGTLWGCVSSCMLPPSWNPGCHLARLFHCAMNHRCYAITPHFTTSEDCFSHTQQVEFSKMWNGANAQGKYNTISTSTVARHLWSRQNTENTVPVFCTCRNHFMQVKWYSMFILSCKVVRVCQLNEGWIHPGYRLSSPTAPFPNCRATHPGLTPPSFHPSTLYCVTSVNIRVHGLVLAVSLLQIHFSGQNWMWDYYPAVQFHFASTDVPVYPG